MRRLQVAVFRAPGGDRRRSGRAFRANRAPEGERTSLRLIATSWSSPSCVSPCQRANASASAPGDVHFSGQLPQLIALGGVGLAMADCRRGVRTYESQPVGLV